MVKRNSRNLLYYVSFGKRNKNIFLTAASILSSMKFNDNSYDILLYCDKYILREFEKSFPEILNGIYVWRTFCNYTSRMDESCWARYEIFNWIDINKYDNILYLDTDTIVSGNLSTVFLIIEKSLTPIVALSEKSEQGEPYHGQQIYNFYGKRFENSSSFSTGVLGFRNCSTVENIFSNAQKFSRKFIQKFERKPNEVLIPFTRSDQPSLNFLLNQKESMVNTKCLEDIVINNPKKEKFLISHFPGGVGRADKPFKIFRFLTREDNEFIFSDIIQKLKNVFNQDVYLKDNENIFLNFLEKLRRLINKWKRTFH